VLLKQYEARQAALSELQDEVRAVIADGEADPTDDEHEALPAVLGLVEGELEQVVARIKAHEQQVLAAEARSHKALSEWMVRRSALQQDLQRAAVQVEVAKADLRSFPKLPMQA
jgi:hypothetical protein